MRRNKQQKNQSDLSQIRPELAGQKEKDRALKTISVQSTMPERICPVWRQDQEPEVPRIHSREEFQDYFLPAALEDLDKITSANTDGVKVRSGKRIRIESGPTCFYSFTACSSFRFTTGHKVSLIVKKQAYSCQVVETEGMTVVVKIGRDLGARVSMAVITEESLSGLLSVIDWMKRGMPGKNPRLLDQLIQAPTRTDLICDEFQTSQQTAVEKTLRQPVCFIWGPPGTGKTTTIAKIANALIQDGRRVLLLSMANVAVDEAVLKLKDQAHQHPGTILRYGYPRDPLILEDPDLYSTRRAHHQNAEIVKRIDELVEELSSPLDSEERESIRDELTFLRRRLEIAELKLINEARFIASTIALQQTKLELFHTSFDTVIVDEASMLDVPTILQAASRATKSFVCLGDFRQLSPITFSRKGLLNIDLFQYCQIAEAVLKQKGHVWLTMLNEQYRMPPFLSDLLSCSVYNSLLHTAPLRLAQSDQGEKTIQDQDERPEFSPDDQREQDCLPAWTRFESVPLLFLDLSGLGNFQQPGLSGSRMNLLSAMTTVTLAAYFAFKGTVGIITPYARQAMLIQNLLDQTGLNELSIWNDSEHPSNENVLNSRRIKASTVHQFQGSERDYILFDTVESYGRNRPGVMVTTMHNNESTRLINVAISRARRQFILISNQEYLHTSKLDNNLLKTIYNLDGCDQQAGNGQLLHLCGKEVLNVLDFAQKNLEQRQSLWKEFSGTSFPTFPWSYRQADNSEALFVEYLKSISRAHKEIRIDIPTWNFSKDHGERLTYLLGSVARHCRLVIRCNDKAELPESLRQYSAADYVLESATLIDRNECWINQPLVGCAKFYEEKLPERKERIFPVFYIQNGETALEIEQYLEMLNVYDREVSDDLSLTASRQSASFSGYISAQARCSCGGTVRYLYSKKFNRPFLTCDSCKKYYLVTVEMAEGYLNRNPRQPVTCPRCGGRLYAVSRGGGGIFFRCANDPHHTYSLHKI